MSRIISGRNTSQRPRPPSFAAYIAMSALPHQLLAVARATGVDRDADARADDELAVADLHRLGPQAVEQAAPRSRRPPAPSCPRAGWRTRRRRAGPCVSLGRIVRSKRCASSWSSWSPASWPRLSLTCLNQSRSRSSTTIGSPRALRARERVVEPVAEQRAVREPGELVVERLVRELLFEPRCAR